MVFEVISDWAIIRKYELDSLKVLRIFSLSRLAEVFKRNNKVLDHAIFQVIYTILSIVLLFSCGMLVVENKLYVKKICAPIVDKDDSERSTHEGECPENAKPYVYHEMIYYTVVTITTAGYGDYFPHTPPG